MQITPDQLEGVARGHENISRGLMMQAEVVARVKKVHDFFTEATEEERDKALFEVNQDLIGAAHHIATGLRQIVGENA